MIYDRNQRGGKGIIKWIIKISKDKKGHVAAVSVFGIHFTQQKRNMVSGGDVSNYVTNKDEHFVIRLQNGGLCTFPGIFFLDILIRIFGSFGYLEP